MELGELEVGESFTGREPLPFPSSVLNNVHIRKPAVYEQIIKFGNRISNVVRVRFATRNGTCFIF